jgi:hypothetical protein
VVLVVPVGEVVPTPAPEAAAWAAVTEITPWARTRQGRGPISVKGLPLTSSLTF